MTRIMPENTDTLTLSNEPPVCPPAREGGFPDPSTSFETLYQLESSNFWFRARNALIIWAFAKYFQNAKSFCEIGCGTGYVLSAIAECFPGLAVSGSDLFDEGLRFAGQRVPKARLIQLDARRISMDEQFSVIGMFDVLEHINEDEQVLQQIYNAIEDGGGLLLTVPQHKFLWSHADEYAGHVRRYSSRELLSKLHAAGFTVLCSTSFVTLLMPLLVVKRMGQKGAYEDFDPLAEVTQSAKLNVLLSPVMWLERLGIKMGLRFPVGGSRLIVAAKRKRK